MKMPNLINLKGRRFGRLVVLERSGTSKSKKPLWQCECDCGKTKVILGAGLLDGTTQSCGCLRKEIVSLRSKTHGMRKTRIFNIWYAMKRRCLDRKAINYHHYGGRGISFCERWIHFENFRDDMYDSYLKHVDIHGEKQTTLDRIDPDKDYSPENTRWATYYVQNNNTRKSREIGGE